MLRKKPFENIVRKGENACKQHFLLFLQCFTTIRKTEIIILSSTNALNLVQSNKLSFDKVSINVSYHFLHHFSLWEGRAMHLFMFLSHLSSTCSRRAFRVIQCPPCVFNNFFKHLLSNCWANLNQTWQEFSLRGRLQNLAGQILK